ncbi:hypothetical protein HS048_30845 [Planomonospora sp. ID91781]|uniref:DUF1616 domain-containing protein n=2 Tax=Planomonospora parontospora TaxID=58119 RepID=A0AA37BD68_9ACTN|nr:MULTISPECIES: hypothetical protein [Planomonospora]MBG0825094.1 hypothetical protein [Planomonospora sp. ID91781]GGK52848.1 hypothetical protein GCM10010126_10480 [Planomonospora parontospora]GII06815.1 hypothetical protein Ppa06_06130 [Planomonospora parontospora subsp. parontospora]
MNTIRWPLLLLASSGWLALLTTETPGGAPLRVTVTVVFLLTCPGAAVLALFRPLLAPRDHTGDAMESIALTVALSVALGILVSEAFFMTGAFTVYRVLTALATITSLAALGVPLTAYRARRRAARSPEAA